MKYVKALGLAMAAALALIALLGVSTASATVLCKAKETPCGEANRLKAGTVIKADLTPGTSALFELTNGIVILTCSGSEFTAVVEKAGGAAETTVVSIPASGLTWSGCTGGVSTASSGEWEIHHNEGTDNGTITNTNNLFGKWLGISLFECTYTAVLKDHVGLLTGKAGKSGEWGFAPTIDIHTRLVKSKGGAGCFEDVMWTATYSITTPAPLYVRAS